MIAFNTSPPAPPVTTTFRVLMYGMTSFGIGVASVFVPAHFFGTYQPTVMWHEEGVTYQRVETRRMTTGKLLKTELITFDDSSGESKSVVLE